MSDDRPPIQQRPAVTLEQRRLLRRILATFLVVVVLLPLVGFGGQWTWLLLPLVGAAAYGLATAITLRRSVQRLTAPIDPDETA
ncbi:MAG: hypothetical protein JWO69_1302 [Thermoleophilia bacterium]|nr:hypothetical protein [Thermoleophilia bacterium]